MRTVLENYRKRGMRSEALQQVAQGQEGLIDHVDVVIYSAQERPGKIGE